MLTPGFRRRQSIADPGPIGPPRLIQPIDRPTEPSGSGSASPVHRSLSLKVPCSFALATDNDEVLSTSLRMVVNVPFGVLFLLLPLTPDLPLNPRTSLCLPLDHFPEERQI